MSSRDDDKLEFVAEPDDTGRADHVVRRRFPKATRRRLATLFATGAVRVDGKRAKKGTLIQQGATVEVTGAPPTDDDLAPIAESTAIEIVYEDELLIAVNKPANCPSHPLAVGETGTVANFLVAHAADFATVSPDAREAGLVHRLDRHTTGVLVAAKTRVAWDKTRDAFRRREVEKHYLALVTGDIADTFTVELELETRGNRARVAPGTGLEAHTAFEVIERHEPYALVRCTAETGRMHQVRAHLSAAGAPIVGDALYSGADGPDGLVGHLLHAAALALPHPGTGETLRIEAPMAPDRAAVLRALGFER